MHPRLTEVIKTFEGFTQKASWDYAQYTNGYGTKALHPGEQIDRAEAERRFNIEIEQARKFVDKHAGQWDEGTKAALTSLTFNCGTRWATSGLGDAVRNNDIDGVRNKFLAYTKAGGQDLPGLVKRRLIEATWIGAETPEVVPNKVLSDRRSSDVAVASVVEVDISGAARAASRGPRDQQAGRDAAAPAPGTMMSSDPGRPAMSSATYAALLMSIDLGAAALLESDQQTGRKAKNAAGA